MLPYKNLDRFLMTYKVESGDEVLTYWRIMSKCSGLGWDLWLNNSN